MENGGGGSARGQLVSVQITGGRSQLAAWREILELAEEGRRCLESLDVPGRNEDITIAWASLDEIAKDAWQNVLDLS